MQVGFVKLKPGMRVEAKTFEFSIFSGLKIEQKTKLYKILSLYEKQTL